ncbi:hypothetical protein HID58_018053 [Brassica napus]|uniref:Uncharacterized protein n=1 Tax=Brassica napus TaxID=3708 RepID=A0ABQ8D8U6_BRANA|nr:hypothetical protein HID58_018053 [Brassica napus]
MLKKPPPPRDKADEAGAERVTVTGDRVGRPPMEKVRHRRQKSWSGNSQSSIPYKRFNLEKKNRKKILSLKERRENSITLHL